MLLHVLSTQLLSCRLVILDFYTPVPSPECSTILLRPSCKMKKTETLRTGEWVNKFWVPLLYRALF